MEIQPKALSNKKLYNILSGTVVPRPIAWVSTISEDGIFNLAPFSFFTVASTQPPMICMSIGPGEGEREGTTKDTLTNIQNSKEFVVNVVSLPLANPMFTSSGNFTSEVDEFKIAGITAESSVMVAPPRVKESPIHLECSLDRIIALGSDHLVIGRIVHIHIEDSIYVNGKVLVEQWNPVGRIAGKYISVEKSFDLPSND